MPRLKNAIVLVTRPNKSAVQFVDALKQVAGPFEAVISPAFENEALPSIAPDFDIAIFTSRSGVEFAPEGDGRVAYCVGRTTAQAAIRSGYQAVSADSNADGLVRLILAREPEGRLVHFRGQVSYGDIAGILQEAGFSCSQVVVYRKVPLGPSGEAVEVLSGNQPFILPIFSAETVSILAKWANNFRNAHVIAISPTVAKAAVQLSPKTLQSAPHSDFVTMVKCTQRLIA